MKFPRKNSSEWAAGRAEFQAITGQHLNRNPSRSCHRCGRLLLAGTTWCVPCADYSPMDVPMDAPEAAPELCCSDLTRHEAHFWTKPGHGTYECPGLNWSEPPAVELSALSALEAKDEELSQHFRVVYPAQGGVFARCNRCLALTLFEDRDDHLTWHAWLETR